MNAVNYLPKIISLSLFLADTIEAPSRSRRNLIQIVDNSSYERKIYARVRQEVQLVPWIFVLVPELFLFFPKVAALTPQRQKSRAGPVEQPVFVIYDRRYEY